MKKDTCIKKIIYFDKETIRNMLQEKNKGSKESKRDINSSMKVDASVGVEGKVKIGIPFWERFSFLFTGKLIASAIHQRDSSMTITSTEISEFESLKSMFEEINEITVHDIENSSTFFRVAGGYSKIIQGGVEGIDSKEFMSVMNDFEGYDTYKIDSLRYVRFNNTAFVSNYKRNDLLASKMNLYCIEVGKFSKEKFDFMKQLNKMENLVIDIDTSRTLHDIYNDGEKKKDKTNTGVVSEEAGNLVQLYDVVYACIS